MVALEARERIIKETYNDNVVYKVVNFISLKTVRDLAVDIKSSENRLDILVNNAGALCVEDGFSEDNLPLLMQINYFAPVLLTELLLGKY